MVKTLYCAWIKIDETLPWIELKGEYETRKEARQAATEAIGRFGVKIASLPEQRKPAKPLAIVRARR
jgi:hypothetical protein